MFLKNLNSTNGLSKGWFDGFKLNFKFVLAAKKRQFVMNKEKSIIYQGKF